MGANRHGLRRYGQGQSLGAWLINTATARWLLQNYYTSQRKLYSEELNKLSSTSLIQKIHLNLHKLRGESREPVMLAVSKMLPE